MDEVGLVSHLIACLGFAGLAAALVARRDLTAAGLWLIGSAVMTAVWAGTIVLAARFGGFYLMLVSPAETLRTVAWIAFLILLLVKSSRLEPWAKSPFVIAVS